MNKFPRLGAKQTLAVGFVVIILTGALLLMLPISNKSGEFLPFLDALFTSTSATCVTGLVVYDTWSQFTIFGQVVILLLIQIGGLGFMTIAILFSMVLRKRIGLRERSFAMEAVSSLQISGVIRLVRHILIGTLIFELIGAAILATRFYSVFGDSRAIWFGIFHSVSAFCNAGFDLMGSLGQYSSLTGFSSDLAVNITVMVLIVTGGIGFVIWEDLFINRFKFSKYNLHTKIVLVSTLAMILISTMLFLVIEKDATLSGMETGERILAAFFHSVTPRTAGFNTTDTAALSEAGSMLTMILMFIGASPGSTAGGIKITTFVVIVLSVVTYFRKSEDVNIFNRRLDAKIVKRAYFSVTYYTLLVLAGCFIIVANQGIPIKEALFETLSAIGTVGLSLGVTRDLSTLSKIVVVSLMYIGRLGSLTVFMAVTEKRNYRKVRNPMEKIIIG
ncbi:TrkH family potassium uptake protein [Gudongella sp. DL1XJH-153]|uniref:TrkH family potassium uptake protein n=1 Tax=Gudongella sp. DL1XJH-153 TaxID=3409804 RepID=UPI003BB4CAB7